MSTKNNNHNLTLSIHAKDASRVVKASKLYATVLREVQERSSASTCSSSIRGIATAAATAAANQQASSAFRHNLSTAADVILQQQQQSSNSSDDKDDASIFLARYIRTYRQQLHSHPPYNHHHHGLQQKQKTKHCEIGITCIGMLLFCTDIDKSSKLLHAFELIYHHCLLLRDDNCGNKHHVHNDAYDNCYHYEDDHDMLHNMAEVVMSISSSSNSHDDDNNAENQSGLANGVVGANTTHIAGNGTGTDKDVRGSHNQNSSTVIELNPAQMEALFECILLSVACASEDGCITDAKREEVQSVSKFAVEKLFQEFKSKSKQQTEPRVVSFEEFGEWYNYGGYNLVPWLELLDLRKWKQTVSENKTVPAKACKGSPANKGPCADPNRSVVSFDFSGTMPNNEVLHVNITEENLHILQSFVSHSNLDSRSMDDVVCKIINSNACQQDPNRNGIRVLSRKGFLNCILNEICSPSSHTYDNQEQHLFRHMLEGLYSCFDLNDTDAVDCMELAVGFTFLCSGNKSTKLARAFDLMDPTKRGRLNYTELTRYLRSYLAILVGLSLSTYDFENTSREKSISPQGMYCAIHNGSDWTTSHVLSSCDERKSSISFESFAKWYTEGGFNIAPWLELLDLKKFLNLLNVQNPPITGTSASVTSGSTYNTDSPSACTMNSFVQRHSMSMESIAFSLPLAKGKQLVVLKDDVIYVRKVVNQLGLVAAKVVPGILWGHLKPRLSQSATCDQRIFVEAVSYILSHKTSAVVDPDLHFILQNFFSSFDLSECGIVSGNELMGGLSLLCDGTKSHKLAFAFTLFSSDDKNGPNCVLDADALFYFLRSILIVLFSCCAQSLELTAEQVSSWITDTAKMSCRDVMHHQWQNSHKKSVDFKEFGDWYNAGGHETAPWLELLDLGKWALDEELAPSHSQENKLNQSDVPQEKVSDRQVGHILVDSNENGRSNPVQDQPIKFHLITRSDNDGILVSISSERVARLRQLVTESNLCNMDAKVVIDHLIAQCSTRGILSKTEFDSGMRRLIRGNSLSLDAKNGLSELLHSVFYSFERGVSSSRMGPVSSHEVSVYELACGFSVLCGGKKSDKLECTFDIFDHDHDGKLVRSEVHRFLRSFITLYICLSSTSSNKNIYDQIDSAASWTVDKIYESQQRNGPYISFDDFAQWYSEGGFSSIPWLELLDLRKWVLA